MTLPHRFIGLFGTNNFPPSVVGEMALGKMVTRPTEALPQTAAKTLFNITSGHVLLVSIMGFVTTVVGAVANATKLKLDSDGAGATTDLCATVEFNAAAVNSIFTITGTFANAMVKTVNLPIAGLQPGNIILPPGKLQLDCAGSDGGTGRVTWTCIYVPLQPGAELSVA